VLRQPGWVARWRLSSMLLRRSRWMHGSSWQERTGALWGRRGP
jgi:hypothetical protein